MPRSAATIATIICCCLAPLHLPRTDAFQPPRSSSGNAVFSPPTSNTAASSSSLSSSSSLQAFKWPTLPSFTTTPKSTTQTTDKSSVVGERNGLDANYPWRFEGRFIFRPSLVRVSDEVRPPSATLLSLFGYSLGGSVVLEYDVSPVGPYTEYVTMGGVVGLGRVDVGDNDIIVDGRTLGVGQWGTNLYVSTQVAEDVCQNVWGVPAQVADIEFTNEGTTLVDGPDDDDDAGDVVGSIQGGGQKRKFQLSGWDNARISNVDANSKRYGNIPIYWTPTIKALWAPLLFPGGGKTTTTTTEEKEERKLLLPLHKLRLSASALRLKRCKRTVSSTTTTTREGGEIPLGLTLVVDNVLIEIGERVAGNL